MKNKKIIILCVDGMDPFLTKDFVKKGCMENVAKLTSKQPLRSLRSTTPPQSPVAWESFITGKKPCEHGVFDFLTRDPRTYQIESVFDDKTRGSTTSPFWRWSTWGKLTGEILFLPNTYPPQSLRGSMVSGMGVPDLLGSQGTFQLYSTNKKNMSSGILHQIKKSASQSISIVGPSHNIFGLSKVSSICARITIKSYSLLELEISGHKYSLSVGNFSKWVPLIFHTGFTSQKGTARFYLRSIYPEINLYLSPISIDPFRPDIQISYPKNWIKTLTEDNNQPFDTLGLPYPNSGLREDALDVKGYLSQSIELYQERERVIIDRIKRSKADYYVAYIGGLDSIQHMFWHEYQSRKNELKDIIPFYYRVLDKTLGKTLSLMNKNDDLFLLSDHGFGEFHTEVHLNSILRKLGYLTIDSSKNDDVGFNRVDWGKTLAYAVGYNSIYLNIRQRECSGIVDEGLRRNLLFSLKRELLNYRDSKHHAIFKHIYDQDMSLDAPDLITGYYRGYRSSWETSRGMVPNTDVSPRTKSWSGDHMFDASEVPGVIMSTAPLPRRALSIQDVMSTLIKPI